MGIKGSVNATVTTATTTITMPEANLTVVGILANGAHFSIPVSPGRFAQIVNSAGGSTAPLRRIHFKLDGTALNVVIPTASTTTVLIYYGDPLANSQPLLTFTGIATAFTLVAGAATITATFPTGGLTLTGVSGRDTTTPTNNVTATWNVSSGKVFAAFLPGNQMDVAPLNEDIMPLDMPVAQTLSVTVAGTGTDTGFIYHFYK